MIDLAGWASEQRRTYLDNAGMAREYRTQLRGIKAPIFLSAYSGLLVMLACLFYFGSTSFGTQSISGLQQQLAIFYNVVVGMLEVMVGLVAPVLAASSIVSEYQRQSIDLLFSSPVGPKYFLVGKMMASYRYVLLLLALSLPIPAMCVVLGGATWKDVLSTYILVSLHGLVYMSISLPIAVMTAKAVPAVLWSYLACMGYFILSMVSGIPLMAGGMGSTSVPFIVGLSPIASSTAGRLGTDFFGSIVPVWIPTALVVLIFVRLMIVGAGCAITQAGSKECFNLRVTGLVLCFSVPMLTGLGMRSGTSIPFTTSAGNEGAMLVWLFSLPLLLCLPYLSTWAGAGGAKSLPNGWWKPKFFLRGTPGSGLPYLCAAILALTGGVLIGIGPATAITAKSLFYLFGVFSNWAFAWTLGWAASALAWRNGIESSRRLHILFIFIAFIVPLVGLSMIESMLRMSSTSTVSLSEKAYLFSFVFNDIGDAWYKVVIVTILAVGIGFAAERKRKHAVESMRSLA